MAWDTAGPLNRIQAILVAVPGLTTVYKGIPETIGARVTASVSVGAQRLEFDAFRILDRMSGYFVEFAYRVAGDSGAPEDQLATFLDAFLAGLYADQTLGGTCQWIETDFSLTNDPAYRPTAGLEYRTFVMTVWAKQINAV